MKNFNLPSKVVIATMVLGMLFTACSNDESVDIDSPNQDYSELALSSEVDETVAALDDISLDVFEQQESLDSSRLSNETSRTNQHFNNLPDCVTITVVIEQNYREVTLDFGTEGCLVRGNLLKGKIILSWDRDPQAQQVLITKSLVDFYFNAKNIVGTKTILKQRSNENENPQFTHTLDLTITWPNGLEASHEGTKIREWIEGHGSGVWSDNVFEITGNWTTNFVNGNSHSYEVIIPLRREVICHYFVSGSIDVVRTNFSGVLDYGEGDCDNQATFTFENGDVIDITLN
ncbi:MAG: hypothetical protein HKO81_06480 [Flavobacteriaceae bacterium]|nr:hypothetical protein [Flavobacteriaceae bacterium]